MSTNRKIAAMSALWALLVGLLVVFAAPANATTGNPCVGANTASGTGDCYDVVPEESYSSAAATTKVTDVAVNGVDIHSKVTVLAFVKAKGMPKAQQTNCFRTKKPMKLWTSYINTSGQEVWHWKFYPAGKKFCKGSDGWYHDTVCYNKVKVNAPKTPPPGIKVYGKVKIVKKFTFKAKATAEVKDEVTAKALAWANTESCHAEASAKGAASYYASAKAKVKGRVLVNVLAEVKGKANGLLNLKLAGKSLVDIHADTKAKAGGKATATATAQAVCEGTPTTPPVVTPPTKPLIEAGDVVHLVINPNTDDPKVVVWARVKVDPSATASVPSPTVSPAGLAYVSDWDKTTAPASAEPGWVYYSGLLHGYPNGPEGTVTLTFKVTDSFGNTASAQDTIQIVHAGGANV